jgi:hypothetical protein
MPTIFWGRDRWAGRDRWGGHGGRGWRRAPGVVKPTPLVLCDARDHAPVKNTLICLVESIASAGTHTVPVPGSSVIGH